MNIEIGDIIQLKKPHPYGNKDSSKWRVLRVGADFRLECMGCGHQVMMKRSVVEKNIKGTK